MRFFRANKPVVLTGILCLFIGMTLYIIIPRLMAPKTPEEVARQTLACFDNRDSNCFFSLMSPIAIDALDLDRKTFGKAFKILDQEFYSKWSRVGEPRLDIQQTYASVSQTYRAGNGNQYVMWWQVENVEESYKVTNMIPALVMGPFVSRRKSNEPVAGSDRKRALIKESAQFAKKKLEPLGIRGVYTVDSEGKESINTWDRMISRG